MTTASLSSLRDLKLGGMASAYEAVLATPLDQHPEAHELIARLVDAERQNRQRRRMEMNLRLSNLRYAVTLQDVDSSPQRRPLQTTTRRTGGCRLDRSRRKRPHHRCHRLR